MLGTRLFLLILALAVNALGQSQNAGTRNFNGQQPLPESRGKLQRVVQPIHSIPRPMPRPSRIGPVSTAAPPTTTESAYIPRQPERQKINRPLIRPVPRPFPENGFSTTSTGAPIVMSTEMPAEVVQDPLPEISSPVPEVSPPVPEVSPPVPEVSPPVPEVLPPVSEISTPAPEIITDKVLETTKIPPVVNQPEYNVRPRPRPSSGARPIPRPASNIGRLPVSETTLAPTTESVVIPEREPEVPEYPSSKEWPNPEQWTAVEPEDVVVETSSELPSSELPIEIQPEPEIITTPVPEPTTFRYPTRPFPIRPYPTPSKPEPKPRPSNPKYNKKPTGSRPSVPPSRPLPSVAPVVPTPKPSVVPSKDPVKITPIPTEPMQYNFECTKLNGYFSLPNECDSYIECKKNVAYRYECPDGLHYNPNILWPEYPCAFPSEVKCEGKINNIPQPTSECPRRYGFFPMNDGSCGQYIMCQEGKATVMNCPPGLAFNAAESSCDWPINVPSCELNTFQGFTCPAAPMDGDTPSDLIYKYRYGSSCKEYVACQLGHPRLLSCDFGLSFDESSETCIDSEYVENCKNMY